MSQLDQEIQVPQGNFRLQRLPSRRRELLRAWDAADEYLLQELAGSAAGHRVLVVNDAFGALAVALAGTSASVQAWSDSWLSQQATRLNLTANGLEADAVSLVDSLSLPSGPIDVVAIKVPKTLGLLEDQLVRLRPMLTSDTRFMLAGMIKALPKSLWELLERLVGSTDTAPGWKKAKLIRVTPDSSLPVVPSPFPISFPLDGTDWTIRNHANVFSRDSLDIGTRFFLEHLPKLVGVRDIVDLGCGNGVLGLIAAQQHPDATVHFVDESHMAIASARENVAALLGADDRATFAVGDGLAEAAPASVDLVLCNPPFHQQQTVGDHIAQRMFRQAHHALKPGGELWVVGNRHLGYHVSLKQLFGGVRTVASNPKFVVLRAVRRGAKPQSE